MIINSFHTDNIHTINKFVKQNLKERTAIHLLIEIRGFLAESL